MAVVDDLSSGRLENLSPAASFHRLDICDSAMEQVLAREKPHLVCHHAAQVDLPTSLRQPEVDLRTNVVGLVRLASACLNHGVEMFVFASSGGAIYGEPDRNPVSEFAPARPLSPNDINKLAGELYLLYLEAVHKLPVRILRYANVYGPRQVPHGEAAVVAVFAEAMLEGRRPRIFGDGSQQRDFVYVGDVVRAVLRAPEAPNSDPLNIGTGTLTSVNDLYQAMADVTGFREPPIHAGPRPGEVHAISLDVSRARERLGWRPEIGLMEGLRLTVAHAAGKLA